jgi:hypothetical protein
MREEKAEKGYEGEKGNKDRKRERWGKFIFIKF